MTTLSQDAANVQRIRKQYEALQQKADDAKLAYKKAERALFERMEQEEVTGIKYRGTLFVPSSTIYGQVQDQDAFERWAQENAPEMFEAKPRKQLVSELVREYIDNGTPLPPGLGFYRRDYVGQRSS